MKCPHCNKEIDNKFIAAELGKKGGKKSSGGGRPKDENPTPAALTQREYRARKKRENKLKAE